jgi:hypothetical protein
MSKYLWALFFSGVPAFAIGVGLGLVVDPVMGFIAGMLALGFGLDVLLRGTEG